MASRIQDTANLDTLEGLGHLGRVEPMRLFCFPSRPYAEHAQSELGHLPHLLFQRHVCKQGFHSGRPAEREQRLVRQAAVGCVCLTRLNTPHREQESQNGNPSGRCGVGSVVRVNHLNVRKGLGRPEKSDLDRWFSAGKHCPEAVNCTGVRKLHDSLDFSPLGKHQRVSFERRTRHAPRRCRDHHVNAASNPNR